MPSSPRAASRIAAAFATLLGPLASSALGLPRPTYTAAWILGGALAGLLLLRGARGRVLPGVALLFSATTLSVAAADLLLRTPLGAGLFPLRDRVAALRWPPNPDLHRYPANRHFEGTHFGDLAAMTGRVEDRVPRLVTFVTDDRGFRNPPPLPEAPLEALLLGDSFGVSGGTTEEETWLWRLREAWGIRIYSLSVPGSPWGELLTLETELPHLALAPGATVLWVLFTGNDLDDRYRDYLEPPPPGGPLARASVRYGAFRRSSPLRQLWQGRFEPGLRIARAAHDPSFLYVLDYQEKSRRSPEEVRAHGNFPRLERVFEAMGALAGRRGLRVVVALVPTKWETYAWLLEPSQRSESRRPSGFGAVVEGLSRRQGFAYVDLKPALVSEARLAWQENEYVFWPDDTHWNGRGQLAAARVVAPLLIEPQGVSQQP